MWYRQRTGPAGPRRAPRRVVPVTVDHGHGHAAHAHAERTRARAPRRRLSCLCAGENRTFFMGS